MLLAMKTRNVIGALLQLGFEKVGFSYVYVQSRHLSCHLPFLLCRHLAPLRYVIFNIQELIRSDVVIYLVLYRDMRALLLLLLKRKLDLCRWS